MGKFNILPSMVFPSTKMNSVNKLITEGSLTRLINSLIDTDSYIIPPKDIDLSDYVDVSDNNADEQSIMINIPSTNGYTDSIEFILKGYYFNLGTIRNILESYQTNVEPIASGKYVLSSQIFVDSSEISYPHYYYPELRGEQEIVIVSDEMDATIATTDANGNSIRNLSLDDVTVGGVPVSIDAHDIKNISFYAGDVLYCSGYVDSTTKDIKPNEQLAEGTYKVVVTYYEYSNIINLYLTPLGDNPDFATVDDDSVTTATMDLLYIEWDNMNHKIVQAAMPINKFHKFKHSSIESIDGGIL